MSPSPTVSAVSHVTVPCGDLGVAEEFYVTLLGLDVVGRVDAERRAAMGWPDDAVVARSADHVSVSAAGGGVRLELFEYPQGAPASEAPKHPHTGLHVDPSDLDGWRARLEAHGVVVDGPRRLGPVGQASLYFDDPFGNHLEIHTEGYPTEGLPFGGPRRPLGYTWPSTVPQEA